MLTDDWNDWFRFQTQYYLVYVDIKGRQHRIGQVKIGERSMRSGQRRPNLPNQFTALSQEFFSLGQDEDYYEELNSLDGEGLSRSQVLLDLRDLAYIPQLIEEVENEPVLAESLLRSVQRRTVEGQLRRLAKGGIRLSNYSFRYELPPAAEAEGAKLIFSVKAESLPPTNVHVIIGRNGAGKTTLLNAMTRSLLGVGDPWAQGAFSFDEPESRHAFSHLVSVTFSAFDPFLPIAPSTESSLGYTYIGLKESGPPRASLETTADTKSPDALAEDFKDSLDTCRGNAARLERWRRALETLSGDPTIDEAQVSALVDETGGAESLDEAIDIFKRLSSGHKATLLAITRLVECVDERTLILMDEPEAHLHPPLLSAFVRAISELLYDRNGVAIMATHSPVVLQEVPKACVSVLKRFGHYTTVERPEIETFGENVGTLTREVFGLEVSQSGFLNMLSAVILQSSPSYEEVLRRFGGSLGAEARGQVQALIASRNALRDN
nr:AAA family ATPase [uncultured Pseudokineococcus sp.]